ncbi:MAG: tyrosine-type recombinase/integrase [Spongiibacteraceae bacterium]
MMHIYNLEKPACTPWNKGRLIGQKPPFKLKEIWAIRYHLEQRDKYQHLAMFNMAIDSKLRGCDLVRLRVSDVMHGSDMRSRSQVVQRKTGKPVRFEITEPTRNSLKAMITRDHLAYDGYLFHGRIHFSKHLSTRQYARVVRQWAEMIGLDSSTYGTHSLRRTKATLIYRRTKNIRAVQLLLGHTNLDSTVRYLGIELDDALEIAENTEI